MSSLPMRATAGPSARTKFAVRAIESSAGFAGGVAESLRTRSNDASSTRPAWMSECVASPSDGTSVPSASTPPVVSTTCNRAAAEDPRPYAMSNEPLGSSKCSGVLRVRLALRTAHDSSLASTGCARSAASISATWKVLVTVAASASA